MEETKAKNEREKKYRQYEQHQGEFKKRNERK